MIVSAASALAVLANTAMACEMPSTENAKVAAVMDGRTVSLSDGRIVRLAGIEAAEQSDQALGRLVLGAEVSIRTDHSAGVSPDRYGRTVAYLYRDGQFVQQTLLESGDARVSSRIPGKGCAEILFAAERLARDAKRGLWARGDGILPATDRALLLNAKGRFAIAEGEVVSVNEAGATTYVNFARRWSSGLTLTILRRNLRLFSRAGIVPKQLEGKRIRVRGTIEQRNGPVIEAETPEQIELVK